MAHLHIIYKIINKINKKFYIGYHKTKNINDEYFGSGNLIKRAIKKYGKENFDKKILFVFTNEREAFKKEKELVNENLINSKNCYNINLGGHGGFEAIRRMKKNTSCLGRKIIHNPDTGETKKVFKEDLNVLLLKGWVEGFSAEHRKKLSIGGQKKIQTLEHRKKNSESKKNAVIMINKDLNIKKFVKKDKINEYESKGWRIYSIHFKKINI